MKPAHLRGLLALGLAGTLLLVWFAPGNEDSRSASTKRVETTRKAPAQKSNGDKKAATAKPDLATDGQLLANAERSPQRDDVPDLFRSFSWYVAPPLPPPAPPPPPPKPTAPPLPFAFIGQYVEGSRRLIILTRGDRLLTVTIGEVIDNTYKVESLTGSQLMFVYLPLATTQTLNTGVIQ